LAKRDGKKSPPLGLIDVVGVKEVVGEGVELKHRTILDDFLVG